ncbi:MAG: NapC/NirT family cytochrome c [Hahellaceae bacterium]|nr:NapC/NirT family cytochrome c [Hahellaceae bacterium]MCP5169722.1 NapC/NirT family cytochrome c [Hahellaceae bacterium]
MNDKSWLQRLLAKKLILGTSLGTALVFMVLGVIFWGGFNWSLEMTNTEKFCISCHEMEENVYQEYKETVHYSNRSGVRATCPDCHVPKDWIHKIQRKIQASNEVLHKLLGSIDTPEKFNAKRIELAKHEWARMKGSDSRECRNCHNFESMYQKAQKPRALKQHTAALQAGNTCIDCHKGIAHKSVRHLLTDEELEALEAPNPELAKANATLHLFARDLLEAAEKKEAAEQKAAAPAPVATPAVAPATSSAPASTGNAISSVNWAGIEARKVTLFYPGQASIEWIHSREHGGKRAFTKGDRCMECHDQETMDMGQKIVTGEKLEPTPIDGKRGSIPVDIKAAYDSENLYLHFSWPDTAHVPVAFADGGKMDPANPVKLAMMIGTDDPEFTDRAGCWGSCHDDVRNMPGTPDAAGIAAYSEASRLNIDKGLTKYLGESRTEVSLKGDTLGGWDKLKSADEIAAELAAGKFLDIIRYQVGTGVVEDGYLLDERKMSGGQGAEFSAQLVDGVWNVEMKRKLTSTVAGDVSFDPGMVYNIGFAIHDDFSNSRFHHVSLGYKLGFDNAEAEINAVKQ